MSWAGVIPQCRDRHPEQARENMAQLQSIPREYLERELAGPAADGAEEPQAAAC